MIMMWRRIWLTIVVGISAFVIGGGIYYYQKHFLPSLTPREEGLKIVRQYQSMSTEEVNFQKASENLEALLKRYPNMPKREEAWTKILWASSLAEINPTQSIEILKGVVIDSLYPDDIKAAAINFIIGDYETNFIDQEFLKREIFKGPPFGDLLVNAAGDVELAFLRLNEQSDKLFPANVIANYRIALWHAEQLSRDISASNDKKTELLNKINQHLAVGDNSLVLFGDTLIPQRKALAYELKARTLNLSGNDKKEVEKFFNMAIQTLRSSQNVFHSVAIARVALFHAAFLTKNNLINSEELKEFLKPLYDYLSVLPEPRKRNVRLVSFLIAARDSTNTSYPYPDFNKADIENISKLYPELGGVIQKLDFQTYIQGHPLEEWMRGRGQE